MHSEQFKPVRQDTKAELACAMQRPGFKAAWDGLEEEYAALNELLQARKQALKQAASSPVERATIEIVALMFQSLLTEERIPAAVRVWWCSAMRPAGYCTGME